MKYSLLLASAVVAMGLDACTKPAVSAETGYSASQSEMSEHGAIDNMNMPDDGDANDQNSPGNTVPQASDGSDGGTNNQGNPGSFSLQNNDGMQIGTYPQTHSGASAGSDSGTTVPMSPIK